MLVSMQMTLPSINALGKPDLVDQIDLAGSLEHDLSATIN